MVFSVGQNEQPANVTDVSLTLRSHALEIL